MSLESAKSVISQDIDKIISAVGKDYFQPLAGKDLLITGPQGLLGGYIVDTIVRLNETVLRDSPCWIVGLSRSPLTEASRLGHLFCGKEFFTFSQHNAARRPYVLGQDYITAFIIHTAGRSSPSVFTQDPIGTIDINVNALRWLLDLAMYSKIKSFGWMSSSEIYGNPPPEEIPTPETYHGNSDSLGVRSCYTESKRCGEAMCLAFHVKHSVPIKIFRPALVYGPGFPMDDGRVINEFISKGIKNKPIQLRDDGSAQRCYCYIKDAMIVFWKAFLSDKNGEVFNIGDPSMREVTIKDLAALVHETCGIKELPKEGKSPAMAGSPDRVCLSMAKAINAFGNIPSTPLEEGLRRTIAWAKERLT